MSRELCITVVKEGINGVVMYAVCNWICFVTSTWNKTPAL
jgi:hypothetical protein